MIKRGHNRAFFKFGAFGIFGSFLLILFLILNLNFKSVTALSDNYANYSGAYATCSSEHSSGSYPCNKTNDGNNTRASGTNIYWNDNTQNIFPDWVQITLNGTYNVNKVMLYDTSATQVEGMDFVLQYNNSGTWTNLSGTSVMNWSTTKKTLTFPATNLSQIRIYYTGGDPNGWSHLLEFEVFYDSNTQNCSPENFAINDEGCIPSINLPNNSINSDFTLAFEVLDSLVITSSARGFNYPHFVAGNGYNDGYWFQLDDNLEVKAAKWTNIDFSMNLLRGFMDVQDPGGCVPHSYANNGSCIGSTSSSYSSIPMFFYAVEEVNKMTTNTTFINQTYNAAKIYYDWFNNTRNNANGLTNCYNEEDMYTMGHGIISKDNSCVGLNVHLVYAANVIADVAHRLNYTDSETIYRNEATARKDRINQYMWNNTINRYKDINDTSNSHIPYFGIGSLYPLEKKLQTAHSKVICL